MDVIISNCVINLSADKDRVLREAFRVQKPGGRFAVSDVVVRGKVPDDIRQSVLLWVGCIAGAPKDSEYEEKLRRAGFGAIEIEPTRVCGIEDVRSILTTKGIDVDAIAPQVDEKFASVFYPHDKANSTLWRLLLRIGERRTEPWRSLQLSPVSRRSERLVSPACYP